MLVGMRQSAWEEGKPPYSAEVDYISGNGSNAAYIDLGFHPNTGSVYELETVVYDTSYQNKTICAALDTSPSLFWFFMAQTYNNKLDLNYGGSGSDDSGDVCFVNSHIMKVRSVLSNGLQKGWVTDVSAGGSELLVTNTAFTAPSNFTMSSTLRLFNRTNIQAGGVGQIGRTRLSVDGVLSFDLVPCLTHDGEYAMWNAATGAFLSKTGQLTGGMW